jgi:hypothetical protein
MATKPTEVAEAKFYQAQGAFTRGMLGEHDLVTGDLFAGLSNAMEGLVHLSTGVRATYMLLDEVKGLLQRQSLHR